MKQILFIFNIRYLDDEISSHLEMHRYKKDIIILKLENLRFVFFDVLYKFIIFSIFCELLQGYIKTTIV